MTTFGWRDVAWIVGVSAAATVFGLSVAPVIYYTSLWFKYWLG
jgi:hypothetical protein